MAELKYIVDSKETERECNSDRLFETLNLVQQLPNIISCLRLIYDRLTKLETFIQLKHVDSTEISSFRGDLNTLQSSMKCCQDMCKSYSSFKHTLHESSDCFDDSSFIDIIEQLQGEIQELEQFSSTVQSLSTMITTTSNRLTEADRCIKEFSLKHNSKSTVEAI